MTIDDEKDYIMRIIKEMVRMLFSLLFGRRYSAVEVESVNKYEVEEKVLMNCWTWLMPDKLMRQRTYYLTE